MKKRLAEEVDRRMLLERASAEKAKWVAAINATFDHIEGGEKGETQKRKEKHKRKRKRRKKRGGGGIQKKEKKKKGVFLLRIHS